MEADAPIIPGKGGAEALEEPLLRSMERYIGRYPELWLVLRDIWDVKRSDAMNLSQLESIEAYEAIFED